MVIVSGGIDLSAGAAIALTSVIGAIVWRTICRLVAVVGALVVGGLVGLLNGAIISDSK